MEATITSGGPGAFCAGDGPQHRASVGPLSDIRRLRPDWRQSLACRYGRTLAQSIGH